MRALIWLGCAVPALAAADPPKRASAPSASATATATASTTASTTAAPSGAAAAPVYSPLPLVEPPAKLVPSLRLEGLRIAGERVDSDWRYPTPGAVFGLDTSGGWFLGYGRYQPRTARSAALHGGSVAATLIGEILLRSGTPAAGVGVLLTGATLDAAAADADRDAESRRPLP